MPQVRHPGSDCAEDTSTQGQVETSLRDLIDRRYSNVTDAGSFDAATVEAALVCFEGYRRDGTWRLRTVGQGYDDGLAVLTRDFGVD